jgi:hypothetical protein
MSSGSTVAQQHPGHGGCRASEPSTTGRATLLVSEGDRLYALTPAQEIVVDDRNPARVWENDTAPEPTEADPSAAQQVRSTSPTHHR